jgi:hypothetical protein
MQEEIYNHTDNMFEAKIINPVDGPWLFVVKKKDGL